MILDGIGLRNLPDSEDFPFNLPLIKNLENIHFSKPISFFVGENGAGKSTLLEGIAAHLNLPTAGSQAIDEDPSLESARYLSKYLSLKMQQRSTHGFFSRAEDFIGFVKYIKSQIEGLSQEIKEIEETMVGGDIQLATKYIKAERQELIDRYTENLDAMSHGEGFLKFFVSRITGKGLYLIDEPEAALSPQRQLSLISLIKKKVDDTGSQFIIATHSPIIMAIPEAEIFYFEAGKISLKPYYETEHFTLCKSFITSPELYLKDL
jgi:predicted ATPase